MDLLLLPVLGIFGALACRYRGRFAPIGWAFAIVLFAFYLAVILWVLTHQPPPD